MNMHSRFRALDVAGGDARLTQGLLLEKYNIVDLFDQCPVGVKKQERRCRATRARDTSRKQECSPSTGSTSTRAYSWSGASGISVISSWSSSCSGQKLNSSRETGQWDGPRSPSRLYLCWTICSKNMNRLRSWRASDFVLKDSLKQYSAPLASCFSKRLRESLCPRRIEMLCFGCCTETGKLDKSKIR